jgi:hypothetical protein
MSHPDHEEAFDAGSCPVRLQKPVVRHISGTRKLLGEGLEISRLLPTKQLRMIGAWTFLDHIGPADVSQGKGVRVGPHPHTGLQTFTWMIDGEMLHRDSLGTVQLIRPGQVNLMTAGRGISHSEESPAQRSPRFHAAQLWIALPEAKRFIAPAFEHHPVLPSTTLGELEVVVIAGTAFGQTAPTTIHSPLMAADIGARRDVRMALPLNPAFEHGLMLLQGAITVEGEALATQDLLYLAPGHAACEIQISAGSRLLLIGGEPFGEDVLMWWNFVGRGKAEMSEFVRQWNEGDPLFGTVTGYDGERLLSPPPPWNV